MYNVKIGVSMLKKSSRVHYKSIHPVQCNVYLRDSSTGKTLIIIIIKIITIEYFNGFSFFPPGIR